MRTLISPEGGQDISAEVLQGLRSELGPVGCVGASQLTGREKALQEEDTVYGKV